MLKKIYSHLLLSVVIALVMVLAGCGTEDKTNTNSNTSANTNISSNAPAESIVEPSEEPVQTVELTISAAASMTDALNDIQKEFETANPSIKLNFNFGASGALQQQIEQGAPADLFLSAAVKNMTALVDKQLIDSSQQINLLSNELVVVVPNDAASVIEKMEDLTKKEVKTVAIGIPESVPAGNYAKEALTNVKLWDTLQKKSVQAKDVRQVLQYVESGNADAGFVYKTDALTSDKVKVVFAVDPTAYTSIEYPIGIVKATKHMEEAEKFYTYLQSQEALDVFIKYGFSVSK
jgi:molybdenum ABC transporter, periplasmic molybdate-binding protein